MYFCLSWVIDWFGDGGVLQDGYDEPRHQEVVEDGGIGAGREGEHVDERGSQHQYDGEHLLGLLEVVE